MRNVRVIFVAIAAWAIAATAQSTVPDHGQEVSAVRKVIAADEARRQAMLHGDVRT